jgi:tripartite-type tricarboxylate transporter receptor subunit TctC
MGEEPLAMRRPLVALAVVLLAAAAAVPSTARAQPTNVITTNFGPAAATDLVARLLAAEFGPMFGQTFVVKNITGAAGTIAVNEVVRARPDGTNILLSPIGPITIQPHFMRNAGYRTTDLMPICMTTRAPLVLMTSDKTGFRGVGDVVARARQAPNPLNYGSTGPGTTPHLSMVHLSRMAGIPLTHIAYRGPSEVVIALQQGDVQLYADIPNLVLKESGMRAIAVLAPERTATFPDLPTMKEMGYDIDFSIWLGLFAPTGTPPAVIARYEAACEQATKSRGLIEGHERLQMPVLFRSARDFDAIVAADSARFQKIIDEGNLRQAE